MSLLTKDLFSQFEDNKYLLQFLHICVNNMCNANNTFRYKKWTTQEFDAARKGIQKFYSQRAINENPPLPSELPQHVKTAIDNVYKIRHADILNSLAKEKLINSGHNIVENFGWKLKWILGSSKLASIQEPLCQVEMRGVKLGNDLKPCKSSLNFECNLEKINELISVLSDVKKELDNVSKEKNMQFTW